MSTSASQGSIQYPDELSNTAPGMLLYKASETFLETYLVNECVSSVTKKGTEKTYEYEAPLSIKATALLEGASATDDSGTVMVLFTITASTSTVHREGEITGQVEICGLLETFAN
jgi:hypothetical protein